MVYNRFMPTSILVTKLFIPPTRPELVPRPHLIEQLNEGPRSGRKLTLISAPAGFGKTTLVSEWVENLKLDPSTESQTVYRIAWFSLDESDNVRSVSFPILSLPFGQLRLTSRKEC